MPIGPREFLFVVMIPAALALVTMCLAWRPWRRFPRPAGHWGGAAAIGVAVILAYYPITNAPPHFPPREATVWVFWIAFLATLVGLIDALIRPPRWVSTILVFALSSFALAMMLKSQLFGEWSTAASLGALLLFGMIGVLWWVTFEASADTGSLTHALLTWLTASGIAVALLLTGSLKFGQFAMALAGAAGAMVVLILWRRNVSLAHGAMHAFIVVILCLLIPSHYLSELPAVEGLALLAIPAFIWI